MIGTGTRSERGGGTTHNFLQSESTRLENYCYTESMDNICSGPQCDRTVHVKKRGLCAAHNGQRHLGKELTPLTRAREEDQCPVPWCIMGVKIRGLCPTHASVCWRMSLNPEDYLKAISSMKCSVCAREETKLSLDHDHKCCPGNYSCGDCLRGVVCAKCNSLIGAYEGMMSQSPTIPDYCKQPPTVKREPYRPSGRDEKHPGRNKRN